MSLGTHTETLNSFLINSNPETPKMERGDKVEGEEKGASDGKYRGLQKVLTAVVFKNISAQEIFL